MAWTTPRDWTNGEVVTDTLLNTYVRDNQKALKAVDDTTKGVHGLPSAGYLVGCEQGTRRMETAHGSGSISLDNQMGDHDIAVSVSWDHPFTTIIAVLVAPTVGSDSPEYRIGISSKSTTGATAQVGTWYDASAATYTAACDFFAIGT